MEAEPAGNAPPMEPSLRIDGLHIEGWRSLQRVDWPADGPGWGEVTPDMILVGGANGSGKTTLLKLLAGAWGLLGDQFPDWLDEDVPDWWPLSPQGNLWIDYRLRCGELGEQRLRFLFGSQKFVEQHATGIFYGFQRPGEDATYGRKLRPESAAEVLDAIVRLTFIDRYPGTSLPSLLYIPSQGRGLVLPHTEVKAAGKRTEMLRSWYAWTPPHNWDQSLEALLYTARWKDLNAKEEGHPEDAHHFADYTKAYEAFFGPDKRLTWHRGELFVEVTSTGALHSLSELSSGEQQIVVLAAEMLHRWRPGSLVLIDEPELHLHVGWQFALWDALTRWRDERGGQVIAATQSSDLFGYSRPGTNVLLGGSAP